MKNIIILLKYIIISLYVTTQIIPPSLYAAVMQSNTYRIQSDSINFGGGRSVSGSYSMEDTLGELGTGYSSSSAYQMNAGYQSMQAVYISITNTADVTLPNVGGISGGSSTGESSWNVTTDGPAGYSLSISASTQPALKSAGSSVADYVPATGNPDFNFSVGSASSTFGFTVEGNDLITRYKDNGSGCGVGSGDTADRCWDGFSTSPTLIAQTGAGNHPNGATTTIKYQVGIGGNKIQDSGVYTTALTITAVAL